MIVYIEMGLYNLWLARLCNRLLWRSHSAVVACESAKYIASTSDTRTSCKRRENETLRHEGESKFRCPGAEPAGVPKLSSSAEISAYSSANVERVQSSYPQANMLSDTLNHQLH